MTSPTSISTTVFNFDPNYTRLAATSDKGLNIYNISGADTSLKLKYKDDILEKLRETHLSKTETIFLIEHHYEQPVVALVTNEHPSKIYLLDYEKNLFRGLDIKIACTAVKFYRDFLLVFYQSYCEWFHVNDWEVKTEPEKPPRTLRDIPFEAGSLVTVAHDCAEFDVFLVAYPCNAAKDPGKVKIDKAMHKKELGGYIEWSDYGWFQPSTKLISAISLNSTGTIIAVAAGSDIYVYSLLPSLEYLNCLSSYYICNNRDYKFISISISASGQFLVADTNGEYAYATYLWHAAPAGPDFDPYFQKRGVAIKCKPKMKHISGMTTFKEGLGLVIATTEALYVYSMPKSLDKLKLFNGYHLNLTNSVFEAKHMSEDELASTLIIGYPSYDVDELNSDLSPLRYEEIKPGRSFEKSLGFSCYKKKQLVNMYLGYNIFNDYKRDYLYCNCEAMAKGAVLAKKSQLQPYRPQSKTAYIVTIVIKKLRSLYESWKGTVQVYDDHEPFDHFKALKKSIAKEKAFKEYLETVASQPCHYTCSCYEN